MVAIPKDAVAFWRAALSFEHRRMPARNAGAHDFDAQIFDRVQTEHRCPLEKMPCGIIIPQ